MGRPIDTSVELKGVSSYNNMLALDGTKKLFCVGCGGPRDVVYAETHPCQCCGLTGTQRFQPVFDEFGELVPAEVVEAQREADKLVRIERMNAARAAKAAAIPAEVAPQARPRRVVQPMTQRITSAQPNLQVLPKPPVEKPKSASLAALFL